MFSHRGLACAAAAFGIGALALSACSSGGSGSGSSSGSDAGGTINIGIVAALNGPTASRATAAVYGTVAGVNEVNKTGGVVVDGKKYKLNLIIKNSQGDVTQATVAATSLVQDSGANFLYQTGSSAETTALAAYATSQNKLLFVYTSALTPAGKPGSDTFDHTYGNILPGSSVYPATVNEAKAVLPGVKTAALLLENDPTGSTYSTLYTSAFQQDGIKLLAVKSFPPDGNDFTSELTQLKALKPDVLFFGFIPEIDQTILHQADQLGVAKLYVSTDSYSIATAAGGISGKFLAVVNGGTYGSQASTQARKQFGQDIVAAHGGGGSLDPTYGYYSVGGYASILNLREAIEKAGTFTDPAAVQKALGEVNVKLPSNETFAMDTTTHQPKPAGFDLDSTLVDGTASIEQLLVSSDGLTIVSKNPLSK